jgi:hypothetical protein
VSREQLVAAYLDGRMSRRTLARRLAAGGLSIGAAIAYAHLLEPSRATARLFGGTHFDASVEVRDSDLDDVVRKGGLKVKATADRALSLFVQVYLLRPNGPYERSLLGDRIYEFPGAGALTKRIAFEENPPASLIAVKKERRQKGRAKFEVLATGHVPGEGTSIFFDLERVKDR